MDAGPAGPRITATDFVELISPAISRIHGLDFIDEHTLAVANRDGLVAIVPIPRGALRGRRCEVAPIRYIRGSRLIPVRTPGSVAAVPRSKGRVELLVCNNYRRRLTRHLLTAGGDFRVRRNLVPLQRGLNIPDGVAVSPDGRWIAVSSHRHHDVKLYDAQGWLNRWTRPAGVLRNANYPHGLRFTPNGRHVLVADAGSPHVFVYESEGDWRGTREPARAVAVLDAETFTRGHSNPAEGGPKGLDIDRGGRVVAVTCQELPLALFPLTAFTGDRLQRAAEYSIA